MTGEDNDFDVAKKISDLLKGAGKDRQQKILRWVAENFDVSLARTTLDSPSGPAISNTSPSSAPGSQPGRAPDIKSFVDSKNPKSDNQFAAVVAYYYAFEAPVDQRLDSISADTLREASRLAQRKRLATPLVTLNHAKNRGYLDIAERGQYRINSVGENLVAMALPSSAPASAPARKPIGARRSPRLAPAKKVNRGKKVTAKPTRP
jgi:hypothetical protein